MSSPPRGSRLAIAGWVMFDWACQPFFTLMTTFIYAPYFASAVGGDPVRGQALWGFATAAAGRHKPWIAAFGALLVIGCSALWFGWPGDAASIPIVLVAFAVGAVGVEFATVFNNAMMPRLVPQSRIGWLSGLGWGMGYVGGLVSLILSLAFPAADPHTGRTLLGFAPAFGLDAAAREGERAIGPLSALWFIVFVIPLFVFTPDGKRALALRDAARAGVRSFAATLHQARAHRNVALFLLANMIYTDGLIALFAFGGIYAAGTFGWSSIEIGIFGILLTITGTLGAVIGGRLDDRIGAKPVVLGSLVILFVAYLGILSVSRDAVLFVVPVEPPAGRGLFASVPERLYVVLGLFIGLAAGAPEGGSPASGVGHCPRARV